MSFNYELLPRSSIDSDGSNPPRNRVRYESRWHWSYRYLPWLSPRKPTLGKLLRCFCFSTCITFALLSLLIVLTPVLSPSYARRPAHYTGSNPHNETVYIAACIVDPDLIRGGWGAGLLQMIDAIGPENVFLSVYENDSGPETRAALQELSARVPCASSIVSDHLPLDDLPHATLPFGEKRVRRISYLAEVRNRAMQPFHDMFRAGRTFDKVLWLNDVVFSGEDAADLLFATRAGPDLRTNYRAACAVDFAGPVKFYDTFATRDLDGYQTGVPFYPWFTNAGSASSRQDVLDELDAVRVRSCWGGMVAFEARWFERPTTITVTSDYNAADQTGVQFRGEEELFWEASESCLIHADVQALTGNMDLPDSADSPYGTGIFMNPYIRVAYDETTFRWLEFARRFERLYPIPHRLANAVAGLPHENARRTEDPGQEVFRYVWKNFENPASDDHADVNDRLNATYTPGGCYEYRSVMPTPGSFCGSRKILLLKDHHEPGERMWETLPAPLLGQICG